MAQRHVGEIKRGLTINQFAIVVLGVSALMLAAGAALEDDRTDLVEVPDSELESAFAPAAGSDPQADGARGRPGPAWIGRLRERLD